MTDREAMKMALDALELERVDNNGNKIDLVAPAIEALRQALAQPEQEPVIDRRLKVKIGRQYGYALNEHWFYLQPADEYAEQALTKHSGISVPPKREWVGLTDEEIDSIFVDYGWCISTLYLRVVRSIEAALRSKNI